MKKDTIYPVLLFVVLLSLVVNMMITISEYNDYQKRVISGNERWAEVEERIKEIERCCECGGDS